MDESNEFKYLESSLKDLGLYEHGMDLDEMRSIRNAINESIEDSSHAFEDELQAALKESEQMANDSLQRSYESSSYSSSLSDNSNVMYAAKSSTPPSSPDQPLKFCVVADVHVDADDSVSKNDKTGGGGKDDLLIAPAKKLLKLENQTGLRKKPEDIYSILDVNDDNL